MNPDFAKGDGLVPAIVQHARTGEVLMLGYMDEAALAKTRETGLVEKRDVWSVFTATPLASMRCT